MRDSPVSGIRGFTWYPATVCAIRLLSGSIGRMNGQERTPARAADLRSNRNAFIRNGLRVESNAESIEKPEIAGGVDRMAALADRDSRRLRALHQAANTRSRGPESTGGWLVSVVRPVTPICRAPTPADQAEARPRPDLPATPAVQPLPRLDSFPTEDLAPPRTHRMTPPVHASCTFPTQAWPVRGPFQCGYDSRTRIVARTDAAVLVC